MSQAYDKHHVEPVIDENGVEIYFNTQEEANLYLMTGQGREKGWSVQEILMQEG